MPSKAGTSDLFAAFTTMLYILELCSCGCYIRWKAGILEYEKMAGHSGSYTTSDLSRKSGDIIAEALRHPVTITQRNKPRLVLLNIEDYKRLMLQSDIRASGTIGTMSDSLFSEFEAAVDAYADSDEASR
jgi:prevent-host-death family protein